jgi:hypothetical protein
LAGLILPSETVMGEEERASLSPYLLHQFLISYTNPSSLGTQALIIPFEDPFIPHKYVASDHKYVAASDHSPPRRHQMGAGRQGLAAAGMPSIICPYMAIITSVICPYMVIITSVICPYMVIITSIICPYMVIITPHSLTAMLRQACHPPPSTRKNPPQRHRRYPRPQGAPRR